MTARELIRFRTSRGWTQYQLATALGLSQGTISRFENRDDRLTPLSRARVALAVERIRAEEAKAVTA